MNYLLYWFGVLIIGAVIAGLVLYGALLALIKITEWITGREL